MAQSEQQIKIEIETAVTAAAAAKMKEQLEALGEQAAALEARFNQGVVSQEQLRLQQGMSPSFESQIRELARRNPGVTLAYAISLIDEGKAIFLDTIQDRAAWILEQPDIVMLLDDKKINAIKEVRARTALGLKEAKDAVERAQVLKQSGWMSKAELERLEEEAQVAIASIQEAIGQADV